MLALVENYTEDHTEDHRDNGLAPYLPALRKGDGTDSHEGLDPGSTAAADVQGALSRCGEARGAGTAAL
ncbi:hypothetical protein ADL12_06880 [Streptomyces regalis]|uniref:Uncharacterized protein n=1 Tax=Streptomyces regalis TaxID=68262 RepID=A0A0X3VGJ6_9ACTN|nr:hypothetical protein ADL12_06880 [Streptomyces regalis]